MSSGNKWLTALLMICILWVLCIVLDRNQGNVKGEVVMYNALMAPYNVTIIRLFGLNGTMTPFVSTNIGLPSAPLLEENWITIRDEAVALMDQGLMGSIKKDLFFDSLQPAEVDRWSRFYLKWYGPWKEEALELCPRTVALLNKVPNVRLAMFSLLAPGAKILPHRGVFRGALRYHLALKVPTDRSKCFITLDNERYHWKEGKGVLFDDTFAHWVQNNTAEYRLILFLDIERPLSFPGNVINKFMCNHVVGPLTG
jgi:beta-hydroxylase